MRALRRICFTGPLFAVALAAAPSYAADPAAAQVLFDDARKLIAADKWAEACPKLEESQRLDPGIGTGFHLASCHEHIGRTATAWAEYLEVATAAKTAAQPARERAARERAAALEPRLSRITVTVSREAAGMTVTRDGAEIGRGQWGVPVPIDPGPHLLSAHAPGKKPWEQAMRVPADASVVPVTVPALVDDPVFVAMPARRDAPATTRTTSATLDVTSQPEDPDPGRIPRVAGFVLIGVGAVGLGVGGAFGFMSKAKHDDAQNHCDGSNGCDAAGLSLRHDAIRDGTVATVAFVAGGAAVLTGAILALTAPSASPRAGRWQAAPAVGQGTMGLTLRSAW